MAPKKQPKSKANTSNIESPRTRQSIQSTSQKGTPTSRGAKGKLSQTAKNITNTSIQKKRKKKPVFMRVGTKVFTISAKILKEIKLYQKTTTNLIPKLPFARLVQEIISRYVPTGRRIQRIALEALHEAAETYLVQYFDDSYSCALHARRSTLIVRDMKLLEHLKRP